eukprot:scaffold59115_cov62-Attheya_sp.AAC.3
MMLSIGHMELVSGNDTEDANRYTKGSHNPTGEIPVTSRAPRAQHTTSTHYRSNGHPIHTPLATLCDHCILLVISTKPEWMLPPSNPI